MIFIAFDGLFVYFHKIFHFSYLKFLFSMSEVVMEQFETILMRHGEHGVQSILENWERFSGIRYEEPQSLVTRWNRFIAATNDNMTRAAA